MKNKLKPVALGRFLIVQLVEDNRSEIIIPDTVDQATAGSVYTIRSVGPKCECGAKIGDQIIISAPATHEFKHGGQTYWSIPDSFVAVVLRKA